MSEGEMHQKRAVPEESAGSTVSISTAGTRSSTPVEPAHEGAPDVSGAEGVAVENGDNGPVAASEDAQLADAQDGPDHQQNSDHAAPAKPAVERKPCPAKIYVHTGDDQADTVSELVDSYGTINVSVSVSNAVVESNSVEDRFSQHFTIKFKDADEADECFVALAEKLAADEHEMEIYYETLSHPGNLYVRWTQQDAGDGAGDDVQDPVDDISEDDLRALFGDHGHLTICKIVYDENGESKNYGFVNYTLKKSADAALVHLNNIVFKGNQLYVNHHISKKERLERAESERYNYTNLYVKNIPQDVTSSEIAELFGHHGKVESVFLPVVEEHQDADGAAPEDDNAGAPKAGAPKAEAAKLKGFGFINFAAHSDALDAQQALNNFEIRPGYNLTVTKAQKKDRGVNFDAGTPHPALGLMGDMESFTRDFNRLRMYGAPPQVSQPRGGVYAASSPSMSRPASALPAAGTPQTAQLAAQLAPAPGTPSQQQQQQQPQPMAIPAQYYYPGTSVGGPGAAHSASMFSPLIKNGLPIAGPNYQDSNLYIKNLPLDVGDDELTELFAPFGEIVSAKVITSDGVHSKGYGFVCFKLPAQASTALVQMANYVLDDSHVLDVSFAQRKDNRVGANGIMHHYNQNHFNYHGQRAMPQPRHQPHSAAAQPAPQPQAFVPPHSAQQFAAVYPYYYYPPPPPPGAAAAKGFMSPGPMGSPAASYRPSAMMPMPPPPPHILAQQQQAQAAAMASQKRQGRRYSQWQQQQQYVAPQAPMSP